MQTRRRRSSSPFVLAFFHQWANQQWEYMRDHQEDEDLTVYLVRSRRWCSWKIVEPWQAYTRRPNIVSSRAFYLQNLSGEVCNNVILSTKNSKWWHIQLSIVIITVDIDHGRDSANVKRLYRYFLDYSRKKFSPLNTIELNYVARLNKSLK